MIEPDFVNPEFELGGINHVALVCSDMARTVDFYTGVLGMPVIKSLDLPDGMGQHFFFDAGSGDCVAFFWFTGAPDAEPGVYIRSFYFTDPDGIVLEFACWTKEFTDVDNVVAPKTAADRQPRQPA